LVLERDIFYPKGTETEREIEERSVFEEEEY
jgi:hypothetical protein